MDKKITINKGYMKKNYVNPTLQVVELSSKTHMLQNSVPRVSTNLGSSDAINYGGGSTQSARVRGNSVDWDD